MKSSVDDIRARFDNDVDRFSNLSVAQQTAIDSALCLDLIADGAAGASPGATAILDVGCGAGNWTLKLLGKLPGLSCTLIDLSRPMLDRARERVSAAGAKRVEIVQEDVRTSDFADRSFDLIVAGAVLHHLRTDAEWDDVFARFHRWLRPGGSVWVYDLMTHESSAVHELLWRQYGDYLRQIGGDALAEKVFAYIDEEDTPRPVTWQLDRLRMAGFTTADVLHKNGPFAAYAAFK
ncbi:MAG TPA: class I SAM-dependent methyltransferase [Tepidisphaeraceae bacterium]|jgi:tRNA (cmo5U34)-methyltransferase